MEFSSFIGKQALISDLKSRSDLNGEICIVNEILSNGRLKVFIKQRQIYLSISHENVRLLDKDNNDGTSETFIKNIDRNSVSNCSFSINPTYRIWENISFFYPFGNTPAKLLTRNIPVDQPSANILLLGCGDPRHVLFTSWSLSQMGGLSVKQKLNFLICDIEPAIIARDIFLFKLIIDNADNAIIWSLFFSKRINKRCIDVLKSTAESLIAIGDNFESWQGSNLGRIIRFAEKNSFTTVHEIWKAYACGMVSSIKTEQFESYEKEQKVKSGDNLILTSIENCSPANLEANLDIHSASAHEYLKSGATPSCILKPDRKNDLYCNPLMFSGEDQKVNFHYALNPLCCFHLSRAYIQVIKPSTNKSTGMLPKVDTNHLYNICFEQFSDWCKAIGSIFLKSMNNGMQTSEVNLIKIFVFVGDAFDCCQAILNVKSNVTIINKKQSKINQTPQVASLSCRHLQFMEDVPTEYDVIDTSNISDHLGLLNVLCGCIGLLKKNLHSVIYTDILSTSSSSDGIHSFIKEMLSVDLPSFAIITGFSISDWISQVSTTFSLISHQLQSQIYGSQKGEVQRNNLCFEWKMVCSNRLQIEMNKENFQKMFFGIFKNMFERIYHPFSYFSYFNGNMRANLEKRDIHMSGQNDFASPTAQTFARLVKIAATTVHLVDENSIEVLLESIRNCGFLSIGNFLQDFYLWFYLLGLISCKQYSEFLEDTMTQCKEMFGTVLVQSWLEAFHPSLSRLSSQIHYPQLVLVTLLIPRSIVEKKLNKNFSHILQMSVKNKSNTIDNCFSTFHIAYIKERLQNSSSQVSESSINTGMLKFSNFSLLEGTRSDYQWLACSVVVSFPCLVIGPQSEVMVSLGLSSIMAGRVDIGSFGIELTIDKAPMSDSNRISWCEYSPEKHNRFITNNSSTIERLPTGFMTSSDPSVIPSISTFKAEMKSSSLNQSGIDTCVSKVTIQGMSLQDVTPTLLDMSHPFGFQLSMESIKMTFELPTMINASNSRIQISRKQGFLNLLVPLNGVNKSQSDNRIFRMFRDASISNRNPSFTILGVPRMLLESMAKIDCEKLKKKSWLWVLAGAQLSPQERLPTVKKTALISLKETIHSIVLQFYGEQDNISHKLFGFHSPSSGIEIILFVNSIRLDASLKTIVLDSAVCILDMSRNIDIVAGWFQKEVEKKILLNLTTNVLDEEVDLWKKILPVLCECTRNTWRHNEQCEYLVSNSKHNPVNDSVLLDQIPRSIGMGEPSVCSCCLGKELENTEFDYYLSLDKYARSAVYPHFFRAAIPLVFSPWNDFSIPGVRGMK